MKRQRSHRRHRDRNAAHRRWWRTVSSIDVGRLVTSAARETLQEICAHCCADLRPATPSEKWVHGFALGGHACRVVSCSTETCRTQTAIALLRLQDEMLRREAWHWNAPVRAVAEMVLDGMRGDG